MAAAAHYTRMNWLLVIVPIVLFLLALISAHAGGGCCAGFFLLVSVGVWIYASVVAVQKHARLEKIECAIKAGRRGRTPC